MKNILYIVLIFSISFIISCTDTDNVVNSNNIADSVSSDLDLSHILSNCIKISILYYDSILVENDPDTIIMEPVVSAIEIGDKTTGEFVPIQKNTPAYSDTSGPQFSFSLKVLEKYIRAYHFTLRFCLEDSSIVDVDTLALMYKYPYQSAEIFLKYPDEVGLTITDFNLVDNELYFIDISTGFYKYNLISKERIQLCESKSNRYLAGDEEYQFIVYKGYIVYRYNVKTDSIDKTYNILPSDTPYIQGIEFYNDKLYVLIRNVSSSQKDRLEIYNLNGDLIDTILFEEKIWGIYYCAVYNNVLYFNNYGTLKMLKLDLSTYTFSDGKSFPCEYPIGIKFGDDYFYYQDPRRQFVGTVPISEIK